MEGPRTLPLSSFIVGGMNPVLAAAPPMEAKTSTGGVGVEPTPTCTSTLPRSVVPIGMYFIFTLPLFCAHTHTHSPPHARSLVWSSENRESARGGCGGPTRGPVSSLRSGVGTECVGKRNSPP